jgi:hypothetical protein
VPRLPTTPPVVAEENIQAVRGYRITFARSPSDGSITNQSRVIVDIAAAETVSALASNETVAGRQLNATYEDLPPSVQTALQSFHSAVLTELDNLGLLAPGTDDPEF